MPLILAIEPDRRQAAQLSAVVRKRVSAELILVNTTEQALDAIGDRMPDLVLVPALLSPQDDAALAAALRVIAAAAHVQMLTIPVLGGARPAQRSGGMLSALRRGKSAVVQPDGCDPGVFAEQIASYLEHAALERASDPMQDDPASWAEASAAPAIEAVEPVDPVDAFEASAVAEFVERPGEPGGYVEPVEVVAMEEIVEIQAIEEHADLVVESVNVAPVERAEPLIADAGDESVAIALEQAVWALFADETPAAEPRIEPEVEQPAEQPVSIAAASMTDQWGPPSDKPIRLKPDPTGHDASFHECAVQELMAALEAMPLAAIEVAWDDERTAPAAEAPESIVEPTNWVIEDPHGDEIDLTTELKAADGQPASTAIAAGSEREWVALIESLRHDVERLRMERAEKPAQKPAQKAAQTAPRAAQAGKKAKPVQDEWGFFDPEQCGFAALLAKLDEVTDTDEGRI